MSRGAAVGGTGPFSAWAQCMSPQERCHPNSQAPQAGRTSDPPLAPCPGILTTAPHSIGAAGNTTERRGACVFLCKPLGEPTGKMVRLPQQVMLLFLGGRCFQNRKWAARLNSAVPRGTQLLFASAAGQSGPGMPRFKGHGDRLVSWWRRLRVSLLMSSGR